MDKISVTDRLPEDKQYVLIHLTKTNWVDNDDPNGNRYWKVAKFTKGLTEDDREEMKNGNIPDVPEVIWCASEGTHDVMRSDIYKGSDVQGNNHTPFNWEEFGPSSYFGQEVDFWCELPE